MISHKLVQLFCQIIYTFAIEEFKCQNGTGWFVWLSMYITGINMAYSLYDSVSDFLTRDQKAINFLMDGIIDNENRFKGVPGSLNKKEMAAVCNYYLRNTDIVDIIGFTDKLTGLEGVD